MFKYNGNSHLIIECTNIANELMKNVTFHNKIKENYYDMATCKGFVIEADVDNYDFKSTQNPELNLIIKLYRSKNPWSSAYGYFSPAKPDHIFLNNRKLNRSKGSIVSSLIHEMIHFLDDKNKQESYGHGDNSPIGKEATAPYFIDNIAESIIDNKLVDFNNLENSNIIYYIPWYTRLFRWFF